MNFGGFAGWYVCQAALQIHFQTKAPWCCGEAINASNSFGHWFVFWFCFKLVGVMVRY